MILIAGLRLKLRISNIIVNNKNDKGDFIGVTEVGVNAWWQSVLIICVEYLFYFYVFDWFYHVLFMKAEFMQFEYVIPLLKFIQGIF